MSYNRFRPWRKQLDLSAERLKQLSVSRRAAYATERRQIHISRENRWITTPNTWDMGWSNQLGCFIAKGATKAYAFRHQGAMRQFAKFLSDHNWEVTFV